MPAQHHVKYPALTRRRLMLSASTAGAMLPGRSVAQDPAAELTVTEALRARRSTRAFADRAIDPALLAECLWAAFGINRPDLGLRTAPSWRGAADVAVHVATATGVLSYDPFAGSTQMRTTNDIRANVSPQPFVASAPACLILVSDLRRLEAAGPDDQRRLWALVDAAIVAENVRVSRDGGQ